MKQTVWTLERQVRLAVGIVVLASLVLATQISLGRLYMTAFVGVGLLFAGFADVCPMVHLIVRMPWNRRLSSERMW